LIIERLDLFDIVKFWWWSVCWQTRIWVM